MRSLALAGLIAAALVGCNRTNSDDAQWSEHRTKLMLSEAPADAQDVAALRAALGAVDAEDAPADGQTAEDAPADGQTAEAAQPEITQVAAQTKPAKLESVALVGVIGGVDDPWDKNRAAFMLTTLEAAAHDDHGHDHDHDHDHAHDDHGDHKEQADHKHEEHAHDDHDHKHEEHAHDDHGHDHGHSHAGHDHAGHENCPFCERAAHDASRLAIVEFVGPDGEVLPVDARKLLGVTKNQTVVVRGTARLDEAGILTIAADGIYVK